MQVGCGPIAYMSVNAPHNYTKGESHAHFHRDIPKACPSDNRLPVLAIGRLCRFDQASPLAVLELGACVSVEDCFAQLVAQELSVTVTEVEISDKTLAVEHQGKPLMVILPHFTVWNCLNRKPAEFSFVAGS